MKFEARKSTLFGFVFWLSILISLGSLITVFLISPPTVAKILLLIFVLPATLGLLWIWYDTSYEIRGELFYYKSGPFRGSVKIADIRKLDVNKTLWSGNKPALATKGIITRFNKYDEVYFAPRDNNQLVDEFLKLNPTISVVNKP